MCPRSMTAATRAGAGAGDPRASADWQLSVGASMFGRFLELAIATRISPPRCCSMSGLAFRSGYRRCLAAPLWRARRRPHPSRLHERVMPSPARDVRAAGAACRHAHACWRRHIRARARALGRRRAASRCGCAIPAAMPAAARGAHLLARPRRHRAARIGCAAISAPESAAVGLCAPRGLLGARRLRGPAGSPRSPMPHLPLTSDQLDLAFHPPHGC